MNLEFESFLGHFKRSGEFTHRSHLVSQTLPVISARRRSMEIQSVPVSDSPNNDAFEAVVELYYQTLGYITSSGKWFWVWDAGKRQRGYQDIDVLAVTDKETVIVSVTSNLDDKLRLGRGGAISEDMLKKINAYFERVTQYLLSVAQYKWLATREKTVKKVIAYDHAFNNAAEKVFPILARCGIEVLSAKDMLRSLSGYIGQPNLKIQDQMLRTIQLLGRNGNIGI